MRILIASHFFSPSIGGIETCTAILAQEFVTAGHHVKIITTSVSGNLRDDFGLEVFRKPSWTRIAVLLRWCDVYLQNNVSLRSAWPNLLIRRPCCVATHTWLAANPKALSAAGKLKKALLRRAQNLYISNAIAEHVGSPGVIVGNPYDDSTFKMLSGVPRDQDIVFLGRLVSDKGCDLLIDAISLMHAEGLPVPTTNIIGMGPELEPLRRQVDTLGLSESIRFSGYLTGESLALELNRHRVIAIPSRWEEPFGMVALEGLACGCTPVVSTGGGLPDAVGTCGLVFQSGNVAALKDSLVKGLSTSVSETKRQEHLSQFTKSQVAKKYLECLTSAVAR